MYIQYLTELMGYLDATQYQSESIEKCANVMADTIINDGMIHVTGCGHSQMFALEMFFRAGGLVQVSAILPPVLALHPYAPMSTFAERQHGLAAIALDGEKEIREGDILIVVSTSGRNPVPVEFALEGKKRGLTVIGLTSKTFSEAVTSRHHSGQKLMDVCDYVLDMGGVPGDAIIPVPGHNFSTGSISSVVGFTLLNTLVEQCVRQIVLRGFTPKIWRSVNSEHAIEHNQKNIERYRSRITCL
ncbi:sugar isomerase domain-containing protein [Vibrio mimicus]|uniref:SIS domain-containing protein n=1 Tax=Vibrio mimicus TaxID=674 RepID=A0A2J9VKV9_VIBMI|nr:SIS domain-containing protein [Vibrio mimicus]KFE33127.1 SIS domain protein [Vibrio mimicus]PNM64414.1 SIS domain-containing protein [Vibrio mimicus]